MDNTVSFAELILKFWDTILKYIWPLYFRHEGFEIIKKTYGKPKKIYKDEERWCWKVPFCQTFDIVDMRDHTFNSTAHSFGCSAEHIVPYNIVIDTQVEFRIKDPFVIYNLNNDFTKQVNPLYIFVSNQVHQLLSSCFVDFKASVCLDVNELQNIINDKVHEFKNSDEKFYQYIEINKIIVTSYDYNISLRQIQ